jgi:hypothetical protein
VLEHRETVRVAVPDQVADVPVDEDLPRTAADHVRRHEAAVGAADPEQLRPLLVPEPLEEERVSSPHLEGPAAVRGEALVDE